MGSCFGKYTLHARHLTFSAHYSTVQLQNAELQRAQRDDALRAFAKESLLMQQMPPHPNVIRLVGVIVDPVGIVTEFCSQVCMSGTSMLFVGMV